jgi:hypothetical protein
LPLAVSIKWAYAWTSSDMSLVGCPNCLAKVSSEARVCPSCTTTLRPLSDFGDWERTCPVCGGPLPSLDGVDHPYRCSEGCLNGCPICFRADTHASDCRHGIASDLDGEVDGFDFLLPDFSEKKAEDGCLLDWTAEQKHAALADQPALLDHYPGGLSQQPLCAELLRDILKRITVTVERVSWTSGGTYSSAVSDYFSVDPKRAIAEIHAQINILSSRLHRLIQLEPTVHVHQNALAASDLSIAQSPDDNSGTDYDIRGNCGFCGRFRSLDLVTMAMLLCDECRANPDAIQVAFEAAATLRTMGDAHRNRVIDSKSRR